MFTVEAYLIPLRADVMLNASNQYKKCIQVGQWQRSGGQYKEAMNQPWSEI